jgi:hypothetical protein
MKIRYLEATKKAFVMNQNVKRCLERSQCHIPALRVGSRRVEDKSNHSIGYVKSAESD